MEKKFSEDSKNAKLTSENLINSIRDAIQMKNEKKFETLVNKIPLRTLGYQNTTKLLIDFLNQMELYDFRAGVKIVLRYWSGMETGFDEYEGDIFPCIPTLFLDYAMPFRNLYFMMEALRDVISIEEIAIELFEKGSGQQLQTALRDLFDMVGEPSGELYRKLYDEANNSKNQVAIDFMSDLQTYYTKPAPKPKYIFNIIAEEETEAEEGTEEETEEELPEESDLVEEADGIVDEMKEKGESLYGDIDQCVEYLTAGLTKFGIEVVDLDQTKAVLKEKLSLMSEDELKKYMNSFLSQDMMDLLNKNDELLQVLGPANPLVGGDFTQLEHVCFKYGGCRMLFCNCFEGDIVNPQDDDSQPYYPNIPQWFTGKCKQCNRKIHKRCYAVRRPLPQGGWRGTYCSWNCLHLSGDMDDELSFSYADMFEGRINEMGITDRKEPIVEEQLKAAREENPEGYHFKPTVI
jgi:hypothetical protein